MRNPTETERVKCPDSSNQNDLWPPDKVWESRTPQGERVKYGTLKPHVHRKDFWSGQSDCERTGHAVPVIDVPGKNKDPEAAHRPSTTAKPTPLPCFPFSGSEEDLVSFYQAWEAHIRNESDDVIWPNRLTSDNLVENFYDHWDDYYSGVWWNCID
jgi:hypothetical protein